ncbi:MAG: endonuclease domain-containing protein [Pirellulales bacterium]|nr:endonuclease domain-containing protein [Pirellulales bacterium]
MRARQLCGLKFRRQHPIGPWITDFACCEKRLVVEVDGGYHEETAQQDIARQTDLESLGWTVIRFASDDVEQDAEAVGRAIARTVNIPYQFARRKSSGSGMKYSDAEDEAK